MAPSIAVGDTIPDGEVTFINKQGQIERASIHSLITKKKVIIFGVMGAFFPLCSSERVSPFIEEADNCKSCGFEEILCISVNDPFVMMGWELASFNQNKHIKFLADSTGAYVRSLGLLEVDISFWGWGIRSRWFIMTVEDREVTAASIQMVAPPKLPLDISAAATPRSMAPIAVGDIIPDRQFLFFDDEYQNKLGRTSVHSIATGRNIILFGVPGAFETISTKCVHAVIAKADSLRSKGIQGIYCISVNDPYVMRGWELAHFKNNGHIKFLADSTAAYVKSLGLEVDLSSMELGIRSTRFYLVVRDRKVVSKFTKNFGTNINDIQCL